MDVYPFGHRVTARPPLTSEACAAFVLGAYPSALHVRWRPPKGAGRLVRALAVDDEPEPFWTGGDAHDRIEAWKSTVGWTDAWGEVDAPDGLNGPSGWWVERFVLAPLGISRSSAWITDCLDTYRASIGMTKAIDSVYRPFAEQHDLPVATLSTHPSEAKIVGDAVATQLPRLRGELAASKALLVITLGNAALRVFRSLVDEPPAATKLSTNDYGGEIAVRIDGRAVRWLPLAHPAAPRPYQDAHLGWREGFAEEGDLVIELADGTPSAWTAGPGGDGPS